MESKQTSSEDMIDLNELRKSIQNGTVKEISFIKSEEEEDEDEHIGVSLDELRHSLRSRRYVS